MDGLEAPFLPWLSVIGGQGRERIRGAQGPWGPHYLWQLPMPKVALCQGIYGGLARGTPTAYHPALSATFVPDVRVHSALGRSCGLVPRSVSQPTPLLSSGDMAGTNPPGLRHYDPLLPGEVAAVSG